MKSKYRSKKITIDGITFDSHKEFSRYSELRLLEKAGKITDLQRQVVFPLLPAQREELCEVYTRGKNKGMPKPGKLLEREAVYISDFVYKVDGIQIVEDCKGFRTKDYVLKRKMMLFFHGIRIKET